MHTPGVGMTELHSGGWRLRQARKRMLDEAARAGLGLQCWRCHYLIDVRLSGLHPEGLTVGHIVPVAAGGTDDFDNIAPEHRRCNLAAGARVAPPRATLVEPVLP